MDRPHLFWESAEGMNDSRYFLYEHHPEYGTLQFTNWEVRQTTAKGMGTMCDGALLWEFWEGETRKEPLSTDLHESLQTVEYRYLTDEVANRARA